MLDINLSVGSNYRYLAAHFGMSYDHISLVSQTPNPTDIVVQWIERNPKNTTAKLREVLVTMKRDGCVDIMDKSLSGMYSYYI